MFRVEKYRNGKRYPSLDKRFDRRSEAVAYVQGYNAAALMEGLPWRAVHAW